MVKVLENHGAPGSTMPKFTCHSSSTSMRHPVHLELASFEKGLKPDGAPQDVIKCHFSASTSTTANLNDTCSLDTS